jgi:hypothetical protein
MRDLTIECGQDRLRRWYEVTAVTTVFYVIVASLFSSRFETMDDVAMGMWSSGLCLSLEPTGHIIFSHQIFGGVMAALYRILPMVAWYGWIHLAVMFVADVIIGRVLLRVGGVWLGLVAYLAFLLYAQVDGFVHMQFTKTAFYAALAGLLLFGDAIGHTDTKRSAIGFACALGLLASLIRFESFAFACAAVLPVLAILEWSRVGLRPALRRRGGQFALFLGPPLVLAALTAVIDRGEDWGPYYNYRIARARALDFGDHITYRDSGPVFSEIGWSENHLTMFRQASFYDTEVFSSKKLNRLLEAFPHKSHLPELFSRVSDYFATLRTPIYGPLIIVALLVVLAGSPFSKLWIAALFWAGSLSVLVMILLELKWPPHRVTQPLLAVALVATLWQVLRECRSRSSLRQWTVGTILFVSCALNVSWQWPRLREESTAAREQTTLALSELADLQQSGLPENTLHFIWANAFPYILVFEPFNHHSQLLRKHLQLGSWEIYIPAADRMRQHFRVDNPYLALVDNPTMVLLGSADACSVLRRFLQESYQCSVSFDPVFSGRQLSVWRVRSVKKTERPAADQR